MWVKKLPPNHSQTQATTGRLSAHTHPSRNSGKTPARDVGVQLRGPSVSLTYSKPPAIGRGAFSACKPGEIPPQRVAFRWIEQRAGEQAVLRRWVPCAAQARRMCAHKRHFALNMRFAYPGSGSYPHLMLTFMNLPWGKTEMLWLCCVFTSRCLVCISLKQSTNCY